MSWVVGPNLEYPIKLSGGTGESEDSKPEMSDWERVWHGPWSRFSSFIHSSIHSQ